MFVLFFTLLYIVMEFEPVMDNPDNWGVLVIWLLVRSMTVAIGVTAAFLLVIGERF